MKKDYKISEETRKKMSLAAKNRSSHWKGKTFPLAMKLKLKAAALRKWQNPEYRVHMSEVHKGERLDLKGSKHPNWKGGRVSESKKVRLSLEYKNWRISVFQRDKYSCVLCGKSGGKLNADHIKSFSQYPEYRLELWNGRTLCEACHKQTPNYLKNGKPHPSLLALVSCLQQ